MPVHDWTLVEAGIFHAFHLSWLGHLQDTLNGGLLPQDFYALAEQHAGHFIGDLLTLHVSLPQAEPPSPPRTAGGIALAEAPPRVRRKLTAEEVGRTRRRTLAIRHISGHRLVALLEIVSPSNKDRADSVEQFVSKAISALDCGVHLLLVDLFPPGPHDPLGLSGAVWELLNENEKTFDVPVDEPLTLAAYRAGTRVEAFVEHLRMGAILPDMPLFLQDDRYIQAPLGITYDAAFRGMPQFWRDVLEGQVRS